MWVDAIWLFRYFEGAADLLHIECTDDWYVYHKFVTSWTYQACYTTYIKLPRRFTFSACILLLQKYSEIPTQARQMSSNSFQTKLLTREIKYMWKPLGIFHLYYRTEFYSFPICNHYHSAMNYKWFYPNNPNRVGVRVTHSIWKLGFYINEYDTCTSTCNFPKL